MFLRGFEWETESHGSFRLDSIVDTQLEVASSDASAIKNSKQTEL